LFVAYTLAVVGAGWAYALWQFRIDRDATLVASHNQLELTATALGGQVEAMLHDGIGAAEAGANVVRDTPGLDEDAQQEMMGRMTTGGRYVHALFIVHGDRMVLAPSGTHSPPAELQQNGWRRTLAALAATPQHTWVGAPIPRQAEGEVEVALARRIPDIDGRPAWAGAIIGWETLDASHARLAVDRSSVAIVSADAGLVLVRLPIEPDRHYVGVDLDQFDIARRFRDLPQAPMVSLSGPDPLSGEPRQYVVRRMEEVPLLAIASRTVADSLVAWGARRRASLQVLTAASLAILALTFALYRQMTRRFAKLARSEDRFELAVAGTNDGIWEWDRETGRLFLAPRLLQLLQRERSDPLLAEPRTLRGLVHPEDLSHAEGVLRTHLLRRGPLDVELRLRVGEEYRWFRARGLAVWDEQDRPMRMAGAMADIHDSKLAAHAVEVARRAEFEAKQEFARQLILAQEQERKRLANELHDSVGQNLSLIRNRSLLLQRMDLPPQARHQAEALHGLATDAIEEVRAVAQNLRPLHIEEMGVSEAIEALVEKLQHSSPMRVSCRVESIDDVLQGAAATHVFRIVQEAINNVLRHADAKHLNVTIERDIASVRLIIEDDGRGFDPKDGSLGRGLGLLSMDERAGILGGRLQVRSEPGHGTRVSVEIPIIEDLREVSGEGSVTSPVGRRDTHRA
jgi:two-component system sensor histidine kinase UhpB